MFNMSVVAIVTLLFFKFIYHVKKYRSSKSKRTVRVTQLLLEHNIVGRRVISLRGFSVNVWKPVFSVKSYPDLIIWSDISL